MYFLLKNIKPESPQDSRGKYQFVRSVVFRICYNVITGHNQQNPDLGKLCITKDTDFSKINCRERQTGSDRDSKRDSEKEDT